MEVGQGGQKIPWQCKESSSRPLVIIIRYRDAQRLLVSHKGEVHRAERNFFGTCISTAGNKKSTDMSECHDGRATPALRGLERGKVEKR